MWAVIVGGARNVLAAVAGTDATIVYVSSASALGRTGTTPVPDDHWGPLVDPINYELTKREAHLRMLEAAASGMHVRVAAPTAIYGPGDPSITGQLLTRIASGPLPALGPSDVVQCPVFVDDCAEALVRIAADGTDGVTYPVAGEPVTMGDWIELTARLAGHRPPRRVPVSVVRRVRPLTVLAPLAGRSRAAAAEMLAVGCASFAYRADRLRALGWRPRPLEDGLRILVDATRADRRS
jgi:dihydroflavonol-4-reductase